MSAGGSDRAAPTVAPHVETPGGGAKPARRSAARVVKDIVLFLASPAITAAYLALFPFIAVMMLVRAGKHQAAPRSDAG